jgi:hypothetical protein
LAAAILAGAPLYFRAIVIGQETGLTALSISALMYFVSFSEQNEWCAIVMAAIAASVCALSREYGWIAVPIGIVALGWKKIPLRWIALFVGVAVLLASPWYMRSWVLSGSPFYGLHFLNFPVNPVFDGIFQHYHDLLGIQTWDSSNWREIAGFLLALAPLQIIGGMIGGTLYFRRYGYLIVSTVILVAVWLQSVGYTSGGTAISMRVLSPALVLLSILAAGFFDEIDVSRFRANAVTLLILLCQLWTVSHGVFYPNDASSVPVRDWSKSAFHGVPDPMEFQIRKELERVLPRGKRILSDNAFLYAALIDDGIEVVPVWSPEVRFLFSVSAEEAERRLLDLGIESVVYYPESLNTSYLASASPFYASLPQRWRLLANASGLLELFVPPGS